jgi:hypothetical protein
LVLKAKHDDWKGAELGLLRKKFIGSGLLQRLILEAASNSLMTDNQRVATF